MAKSKGVGRGGARKGSGRKAKALIAVAKNPKIEAAAKMAVEALKSNDGPASKLAALAYETLAEVMVSSPFPASRVTAARAIIDLANAEQARDSANAPTGKKAAAMVAAHKTATAPTDGWGDDLVKPAARAN